MAETRAPAARPLSPHLQVYRLTLTMVMSGAHRITGIFLYIGMAIVAWWLIAAASGPNAYANVQWFMGTWFGRFVSSQPTRSSSCSSAIISRAILTPPITIQ